jgi:hypothetical protein
MSHAAHVDENMELAKIEPVSKENYQKLFQTAEGN